jgi:tetratricopeptide (TPR) repeat protein
MYRVPNPDEKWKQDVQRRIDAHLGRCRTTISKYEEIIRSRPNMEGMGSDQLATDYNELAWLISNTSGDFQEAVKASQRSLELSPNNEAYLDTLGRCYYAAGDFEKAVESQRKAVEAAPHIQVMQRQLKVFEEALAKSKEKAAPIANP